MLVVALAAAPTITRGESASGSGNSAKQVIASIPAKTQSNPRSIVPLGPNQIAPVLQGELVPLYPREIKRPLWGQIVGSLPGQMTGPLPGQIVPLLPGQIVQPLPGQIVR